MTFEEALTAARDEPIPNRYIGRVKTAVTNELVGLDPTVSVEDTGYFNHSAIPDLVLTWGAGRAFNTRHVYIRADYTAILAGQDVEAVGDRNDPVFMSLSANLDENSRLSADEEPLTFEDVEAEGDKSKYVLMTDPKAVDSLRSDVGVTGIVSPITQLVRANFVKGARGLLDERRLSGLLQETQTQDVDADSGSRIEALRKHFSEAAVTSMERTAAIVDVATSEEPSIEQLQLLSGALSRRELRDVLPWLLANPNVTTATEFWERLGSLIDFNDLFDLSADLSDYDISPLITPQRSRWKAQKSYLGLAIAEGAAADQDGWRFKGPLLVHVEGDNRLSMALDGRHLNGRPGGHKPSWSEVSGQISEFSLKAATLEGLARDITVSASRSPDVKGDIDGITSSTDLLDTYRLSHASVEIPAREEGEDPELLHVDFSRGTIIARGGATLQAHQTLASTVLAWTPAATTDDLNSSEPTSVTAVDPVDPV